MREHTVVIEKDPMQKIPRHAVNDAELLVLQRVHGEEKVQVVESYELDDEHVKAFDPAVELERLRTRYKPKANQPHPVADLFRAGAADVARVCGVSMSRTTKAQAKAPRSEVNTGKSRAKAAKKDT